ncbi:hypothetical protein SmJEL517_g05760 [Synchytrium microbalum]|uniref:Glycosyltransferase 2-like domain-containing protein n=1 Tax=Synchytrium microbalum TaxID=1806994 RepID=A0A507BY62_9FUNG|nr:uncharacterized protein SmJEL517_g05760 [Synchytrium microbalum]TPX30744.1 hypothetical protein SmJEL517_g05760 [Synchytrium microbalum]
MATRNPNIPAGAIPVTIRNPQGGMPARTTQPEGPPQQQSGYQTLPTSTAAPTPSNQPPVYYDGRTANGGVTLPASSPPRNMQNPDVLTQSYLLQQQFIQQQIRAQQQLQQQSSAMRIISAANPAANSQNTPPPIRSTSTQVPLNSGRQYQASLLTDSGSETDSTVFDDMTHGGNASSAMSSGSTDVGSADSDMDEANKEGLKKSFPSKSRALVDLPTEERGKTRPWQGNTKLVMSVLSEMWLVHILFIFGGTYLMTFQLPQSYTDSELWNVSCWWKIAWLFPMPYTLICLFGLALPFRTTKFINREGEAKARRLDNLYVLTVTKGSNREAVYRSWNAHRHLERLHPCIRVHVLTDEPYYFENINCYTCPRGFNAPNALYKARALEWYRQTMRYTEHDWVLHLDEESVVDDETIRRILDFIWYEPEYWWGQGPIFYNQWAYWKNWVFTVADGLRVGDDLSRFQLQYTYFHRPIFGAHGSFLLVNGLVENTVTWDLGSLTEDYQFAVKAWSQGFLCGKICGIVREQSPSRFMDFLKQRRRWYVGIRRLPLVLPRIWAFFWTLGIICLYGTIASVVLGFFIPLGTPRWFGLLKDVTFITFVYLYLLGIFIQDLDRGVNPLLMLIRLPMTFFIQFIAVVMECSAVMYALLIPPKGFEVIKK